MLDIGIAVGKGIVHIHAAPDGSLGNQGDRDDEHIFPLPELLPGQDAAPDRRCGDGQQWMPWWILAVDALVIAIGIGGVFAVRRKKTEKDR